MSNEDQKTCNYHICILKKKFKTKILNLTHFEHVKSNN
jgi:hypothetical protein